ncbi:4-hydroxythreonine-4-phosphate dehydrogenase [Symbiobacterium terraclitae]|uniref:4-hydroxythreonine-4-phosphate dehydrogenase n=1 Tax=Symbiobacterium terraclitae TaxID=557451 RepID=A0ABS4JT19_9FIRM|nr:4-hydroxythreonine-4-phosphate dehydrogenase PdxA [Symbiobacterium terraclitae]MBP2018686.1 4-hydroxythreonine-4-phosphate dehydrogenase [Symbiobacterium terraclitae]
MHNRPLIGITMGDPASIGPEIVAKSLANPELYALCRPLVIGDARVMARAFATTGVNLAVRMVASPAEGRYEHGTIDLIDLHNVDVDTLAWGRVQAQAGRAAFDYIVRSIELAKAGAIDAVTTAPINKEALKAAGIDFIGHTEIYGDLTGTEDPLTLFETKGLRIFFLTRHVSLAQACRMITRARTLDYLRRCSRALEQLGVSKPRLAVAALNPHAGEHGLFGDEEVRELEPAIADARAEGIDASGPHPADSVFWHAARGRFDAVLSLYHDQGHIAAKMYDFERTVSITAGLPFLRTSVDHGTAFDIAGTGQASAVSMEEAIRVAARYAASFRRSR